MKNEIIHILSEYITVYVRYGDSIGNKSLITKLTRVYNELLDMAEKNAGNYADFIQACEKKDILGRFYKVIQKCRKEFDKHL